jgi:hypothetical protein
MTPSQFLASCCILVLVSVVVLGVSIVPVSVVPGVPVVRAFSIVSAVLVALPAMIIVAIWIAVALVRVLGGYRYLGLIFVGGVDGTVAVDVG